MNKQKVLLGSLLVSLMAISTVFAGSKTLFNDDGTISCGDKVVKVSKDGRLKIKLGAKSISGSQQFYLNSKWTWTPNFENSSYKIDKAAKTVTFKGKVANSKKEISGREYTLEMALLKDGKIKIKTSYTEDSTPKEQALKFSDMGFFLSIAYPFAAEKRFLIDGQKTKTTARADIEMVKTYIDYVRNTEDVESIVFCPDTPEYKIKFDIETFEYFFLRLYKDRKSSKASSIKMRISADENIIEFKLDLSDK